MANNQDRHPKAYVDAAKGYQAAADRLQQVIEAGEGLPVRDPACFLYAHAVELALKACLLARGSNPPRSGPAGHSIKGLYAECRRHKFLGMNDSNYDMHHLIHFLGAGNERHQYRYPDEPEPGVTRGFPYLPWTKEVVGRLIAEAEPHVGAWVAANPGSPAPPASKIAFGKPTYRKQPVPTRPGP
jgi:HEPN domain-containing protein